MTIASFIGVLGMLGLVLGLLVFALRWLRRFAPAGGTGKGSLPLEVVQRIAVGPRQGIAIVRIGSQTVAVSVGDGGVRALLEVDPSLEEAPPAPAAPRPGASATGRPTFGAALTGELVRMAQSVARVALFAALGATLLRAQAPAAGASAPAPASRMAARPAAKDAPKVAPKDAAKATPGAPNAKPGAGPAAAKAVAKPVAARAAATGLPAVARIDSVLPALTPRLDLSVGEAKDGGLRLSGTVGIVVMMGLLTMLPMLVLMMTGFTRILIVLHFLRQAIGAQSAPPTQLVAGLAILLTGFVMAPTISEAHRVALGPWMDGRMAQAQMLSEGVKPFRSFMLHQVRPSDLSSFMSMSRLEPVARAEEVPLVVLTSAFVTSELRTAFQIGFALFLPFIVIDVVVASVLMSMGMLMLPPAMVSLPFKLLLFVLVDGWTLVIQGLVQSFR
ncbi:MAG: flagellar type III secretion system pore protein FliP [Gemmatimonadetes bacterium]|nr:flagellar type III secretion system pore protein FliP [Gemmatimonadota bacterium]